MVVLSGSGGFEGLLLFFIVGARCRLPSAWSRVVLSCRARSSLSPLYSFAAFNIN